MVADRLGINQATFAGELSVDGGTVTIRRDTDVASERVTVALPAIVSVTDQTGEARYPAFKAIMGAKKKPIRPGRWPTSGSTLLPSVWCRQRAQGRRRLPHPGAHRRHHRQRRR
jgi:electron transfer flavoprotein alpha/beta subunit